MLIYNKIKIKLITLIKVLFHLNTEIESWLDRTYEAAIDKDFYISTILKFSKMYIPSPILSSGK